MRKFEGYDNAKKEAEFLSQGRLPSGAYICKVLNVKYEEGKDGFSDRIVLQLDIAEGEYANFYAKQYENNPNEDKKWKGVARIYVPNDDGSEKDGWTKKRFAQWTAAFEKSNNGFLWAWDETKLKGLIIGIVFGETGTVINGGNVNVTASDDGLNAADGSGTETMGGGRMFGGFGSTASYDFSVTVTGGTLYVNAGGDGLDSNGTLVISGGNVFVDGPVDNGNTAVDSEASAVINGGNLVAMGSSGMLETPSSGSSQNVLVVMFNETKQAGTEITVKDASGKVLLTHTTAKSAVCAILSSEAFESNGTYTVTVGNNSFEVTLTSSVMTVNTSGTAVNAGGFGMGGQMGGQQGGFGGRMNGQMPEMPEGGFNGQAPDMNGEGFGKNGRMPWMRDGQMPEGQVPEGTPEQ